MKTTREMEKERNFNVLIMAVVLSVFFTSIMIWMYDSNQYYEKKTTYFQDVGCVFGGYPTHSNMICEDGVQGDVRNEYGGIIWYCGEPLETKTCVWEETHRIRKG